MTALVLLTLLGLTAGVATGVVLMRRALKKRKHPRGNGETQERSGIIELGGATEEEEVHTYAVVGIHTSIDGRAVLYQELDVGTPDYVNVYNELKGGTYQELDLKGREEEHHYQRPHTTSVVCLCTYSTYNDLYIDGIYSIHIFTLHETVLYSPCTLNFD